MSVVFVCYVAKLPCCIILYILNNKIIYIIYYMNMTCF